MIEIYGIEAKVIPQGDSPLIVSGSCDEIWIQQDDDTILIQKDVLRQLVRAMNIVARET